MISRVLRTTWYARSLTPMVLAWLYSVQGWGGASNYLKKYSMTSNNPVVFTLAWSQVSTSSVWVALLLGSWSRDTHVPEVTSWCFRTRKQVQGHFLRLRTCSFNVDRGFRPISLSHPDLNRATPRNPHQCPPDVPSQTMPLQTHLKIFLPQPGVRNNDVIRNVRPHSREGDATVTALPVSTQKPWKWSSVLTSRDPPFIGFLFAAINRTGVSEVDRCSSGIKPFLIRLT